MLIRNIIVLLFALLAACSFNEREFGERSCASDHDCARPDQACIESACAQKSCTSDDQCGTGFAYSCIAGGCVAQECNGTDQSTCDTGYACNASFCQASFNITSVVSVSNTSIAITFDSPPEAASATVAANYTIDGLSVFGTPTLSGSTVTLTTSPQTGNSYNLVASNVVRDFDKAPLIVESATFIGRTVFSIESATAASSISVTITFSEAPDPTTAGNIANYSIANLGVSGTPSIAANTVTITTGPQMPSTDYTVTVSNVRRASDAEVLSANSAVFSGRSGFNVAMAAAISTTTLAVTFDAAPNAAQATTLANYAVSGLTLSGTPTLSGNVVTLTTNSQSASVHTVTVSNVTRASDAEPLIVSSAQFTGRAPFNVDSATSLSSGSLIVTFDAPPEPTTATMQSNYNVGGLALSGTPILTGNVVTLSTAPQAAQSYTVTVSNVTRASDLEPLTFTSAMFVGRPPFNLTSATTTSNTTLVLGFDAPPNSGQAAFPGNYSIPGLTVVSASVFDNAVTLTTTPQSATSYEVTVANVTRASDGEPLTTASRSFDGRSSFNVMQAATPTSSTISVTFDAAPNAAQATTLGNYDVPGLTLSGTPTLSGNTVTISTDTQLAVEYTMTVSNVTRSVDAEPLTLKSVMFAGRPKFNVSGAAAASSVTLTVTFDAAPDPTQATTRTNYSVNNGLTLSGTPTLSGNTVTITTSTQIGGANYTVTVSGVTRASDAEPLVVNAASFTGLEGFNVISAASVNTTTMSVTFDAAPSADALTLSNYVVTGNGGLTFSGTPVISGNTVTITTSPQQTGTYTVTVSNVTRQSDGSPLAVNSASFSYVSFNVTGASALSNRSVSVTFDAAPDAVQATNAANYTTSCSPNPCTNLTFSAATLSGSTVTLTSSSQQATKFYVVTVNPNVTRASDGATLTINEAAAFAGRASFNVTGATAPTSGSINVTFSAAPDPSSATTLSNYSVPNLTLTGTPTLSGSTVTLNTSVQQALSYTVTVENVTRATDAEPLFTNTATFTGKAQGPPTVTNLVVQSTVPDNGATFYNTGTATVVITGTELAGVDCLAGVRLDDRDGLGDLVNTKPTSCTLDSATQITATFPSGIRTNGTTGWNVQVTNSVDTNTTSSVRLVVKAGLLISEVYVGVSGAGNGNREFIELYNPTATTLNIDTVGLKIHLRNATDTDVVLTPILGGSRCSMNSCTKDIPSHKFWLLASTTSLSTDPWLAKKDGFYDPANVQLVVNGGIYLSLDTTSQSKVIDKVGWGSQLAAGREGTAIGAFGDDNESARRRPGGTSGAGTDTDSNSNDFFAPSTSITPRGTNDPAEP